MWHICRQSVRRVMAAVGLSAALSLSAVGAAEATPAPSPHPPRQERSTALQHTADRLVAELGLSRTGGVYLDNGRLVLTRTPATPTRAPTPGAGQDRIDIRRVQYSLSQLDGARSALDHYAKSHSAGQVQSWYVDVRRNQLVVEVPDGHRSKATRALIAAARRSRPGMVHVVTTAGDVHPAAANLYEGDSLDLTNGMECAAGFNARTSAGRWIVLTAGHCLQGNPAAYHRDAAYHSDYVGPTYAGRYPGSDFAAILVDTSRWSPQPAVDMRNGMARAVLGTAAPVVGSQVCQSSASTGWTCGTVQAYNQTVNYGNGNIVGGLVRFNGCVQPGDSGGAVMHGNDAVGLVSGGQFYNTGAQDVCGQRVGEPNVSFYQPIQPALRGLDARLLTYPTK